MVTVEQINDMLDTQWPAAPVRCLEVSAVHAVAELRPSTADIRPGSRISGPAMFSVADAALWFAVSGAIGRAEPMALTTELSIRFLRAAVGDSLRARARIDRVGRTLAVGTVAVWTTSEAKPTAVAQGSYVLPD